jgi:hypothetical protein
MDRVLSWVGEEGGGDPRHMANDRPLRLSRTDEDARHVP